MYNMDINQAWELVKQAAKEDNVKVKKKAWDDGKYYIFDYAEDLDISPLAVDKNTGEVVIYFLPDHLADFDKAKRVL